MESRNELTEFCPPNLQNRNPKSELHEMNSNMLQSQLIYYNLLLKVHQIIPTSVLQKIKTSGTKQKLVRGKAYFRGEVLNKVLNAKAPPRGPTLLKKTFLTEKVPLSYTFC